VRRDRLGGVPEPDKSRRAQRASHKKFNQGVGSGSGKRKFPQPDLACDGVYAAHEGQRSV
jgi:hypothetical protein